MLTRQTAIQHHQYSFVHRLVNWFFALIWLGTVLLIIFAVFSSPLSAVKGTPWTGFELVLNLAFHLCLASLFFSVPLITFVTLLIITLTINPTIEVSDNGFRIHSLVNKSSWLNWQAIKRARSSFLTPRQYWMLGVEGLSWPYRLTGLFFWLGAGGFQITQSIEDYQGLMKVLRKRRPDLFG